MTSKEILDNWQRKLISRKLLVFIISSIALFMGTIDSSDFTIISVMYMGSQSVEDIFFKYKEKK